MKTCLLNIKIPTCEFKFSSAGGLSFGASAIRENVRQGRSGPPDLLGSGPECAGSRETAWVAVISDPHVGAAFGRRRGGFEDLDELRRALGG